MPKEAITEEQANSLICAMVALRDALAQNYNLKLRIMLGGNELVGVSADEEDIAEADEDDYAASLAADAQARKPLRKKASKKRGRPAKKRPK